MCAQHLLDDFQAMALSDCGVYRTSSQPLDNITEESYGSRQRDRTQASRSSAKSSSGSHFTQHCPPPNDKETPRPRSPGYPSRQGSDQETFSAQSTPTTRSPTMYSSGESWAMAQDFLSSGSKAHRSHHRRSRSHKARYCRDRRKYLEMDDWELGDVRPRVASMPCRSACKGYAHNPSPRGFNELSRIRSFSITSKGHLDKGDCFINRSASVTSSGEFSADDSGHTQTARRKRSSPKPRHSYKVLILGSTGVGKKSIIRKLTDEELDSSSSFDDETEKSVSILLDGEESTMEFVDMSDQKVDEEVTSYHVDAYVVVYSVEDRRSFESAINRLYEIRETEGRHVAVILVANKTDLVRSRAVQEEEGKAAANTYDSKYIEVSAAIDHKIDELLVGVLKQIRLIKKKYHSSKPGWKFGRDPGAFLDNCCLLQARENVLAKLFKGDIATSKSCDNLYVL